MIQNELAVAEVARVGVEAEAHRGAGQEAEAES